MTTGPAGVQLAQGLEPARGHHVVAEQKIGPPGGDAHGVEGVGVIGDADMGEHGAVLLRQAGDVEHGHGLLIHMRRHAEQGRNGDHARAADAGDADVVGFVGRGQGRVGQDREGCCACAGASRFRALGQDAVVHGDEGRAEALQAGEVLVAHVLVDGALAAQFRFLRGDGDAVGDHAAIAAAFAHGLVDEHALGRVGEGAAFPAAQV